jgi:ubiquinone biosynthesis protein
MGLADGTVPAVDIDGIRASFGITEPVDHLTYRELQERREVIRRRMEQRQRSRRARLFRRRRP